MNICILASSLGSFAHLQQIWISQIWMTLREGAWKHRIAESELPLHRKCSHKSLDYAKHFFFTWNAGPVKQLKEKSFSTQRAFIYGSWMTRIRWSSANPTKAVFWMNFWFENPSRCCKIETQKQWSLTALEAGESRSGSFLLGFVGRSHLKNNNS